MCTTVDNRKFSFLLRSACFAQTGVSEAQQKKQRKSRKHGYASPITATYEISIRGKLLVPACGRGSQESLQGNVGRERIKVKPSKWGRRACPGERVPPLRRGSFTSDTKMKQMIDRWLEPVSAVMLGDEAGHSGEELSI